MQIDPEEPKRVTVQTLAKLIQHDRRATAYHEAGHIAASIRLRRPFGRVSIEPNEDSHGYVMMPYRPKFIFDRRPPTARERRVAEAEIVVSLAGPVAEGRHRECNVLDKGESVADLQIVGILVSALGGRDVTERPANGKTTPRCALGSSRDSYNSQSGIGKLG